MSDQLASNLDISPDTGVAKPAEAPLHPRGILGDALPQPPQNKNQKQPVKVPVVSTPIETKIAQAPAANDNAAEDTLVVRLVLKVLFGGSAWSLQAQLLQKRRNQLRRNRRKRQTPEQIMLEHSRKVLGQPDQQPPAVAKVA